MENKGFMNRKLFRGKKTINTCSKMNKLKNKYLVFLKYDFFLILTENLPKKTTSFFSLLNELFMEIGFSFGTYL